MTEANLPETVRQAFQDLIVSDLRELKGNYASLEKLTEVRFGAVNERFVSVEKRMDDRFAGMTKLMQVESKKGDARFAALLAHLREAGAEARNATTQQVYDSVQRLTAVETRQSLDHPRQLS